MNDIIKVFLSKKKNSISSKKKDKKIKLFKNEIFLEHFTDIKIRIMLLYYIIMNYFFITASTFNKFSLCDSNITLRINKTGNVKIFGTLSGCTTYTPYPNEIYINGNLQNEIKSEYNFTESMNNITLNWYENVNSTACMFYDCPDIIDLDFSNFDTSLLTNTGKMFHGCSSITSLDLSNFDTSKVQWVIYMFHSCSKLEYINLKIAKLNTDKVSNIFDFTLGKLVLYSEDIRWENLLNNNNRFINCYKNMNIINKYRFPVNFNDINKCQICGSDYYLIFNDSNNSNENINCYKSPEKYYLDNDNLYKPCYLTCKTCDMNGNDSFHNCEECNDDYIYGLNIYPNNINCYNNCTYYHYYDKTTNKPFCINDNLCPMDYSKLILDKNECIYECNKDLIYKYEYNNTCYNECPENTKNNTFICEEIPTESTQLDNSKSTILDGDNSISISNEVQNNLDFEFNSLSYINSYDKTEYTKGESNNNSINDVVTKKIISTSSYSQIILECSNNNNKNQISSYCNFNNITNNTDIYDIIAENIFQIYNNKSQVIQGENNIIFHITDSKNELETLINGEVNGNISILDLGECENKLREENNIIGNKPLIYLKQETLNNKTSEKNILYEVFDPYTNKKLNLSICKENNINLYVPVEFSPKMNKISKQMKEMGYNIFNIEDSFYQDICATYKSENGTDMLLEDRIDYIYNNADTQCQQNCQFSNYILNTKYINCTCSIEKKLEKKSDRFSAKKIYESFFEVLKYSNFDILKCHKLVFTINAFTKNIGSIIILAQFLIYVACLIIHIIKINSFLENKLKILSKQKIESALLNNEKNNNNLIIYNHKISMKESNKKLKKENYNSPPKKSDYRGSNIINVTNNIKNNKKRQKLRLINKSKNNSLNEKSEKSKFQFEEIKDLITVNNSIKLDAFELNELKYEKAIKYDKRSFLRIYLDLLKREHIIIFTFINCNDYNLLNIKLVRFIFYFSTDMAMNAIFFSDDSMHKIFLNYGKYDFIQQIPQIIYSTIVSQLLEVFLCFLTMTDKYFYLIKNLTKVDDSIKIKKIFRCINMKLTFFFIFTFIFLSFYWYIIASFCAVYQNTQYIFIKDSLSSFFIGLLYPFVLYLIPSGLRICTIKNPKKNLRCIYKLSDIIPFF